MFRRNTARDTDNKIPAPAFVVHKTLCLNSIHIGQHNIQTCVCTYMYVHTYIYMRYTYTCIHIHTHTYTHTRAHACIHTHTFIHTYTHTCIHVSYIHTYIYIHIYIHVHTYIHTYIQYLHTHNRTNSLVLSRGLRDRSQETWYAYVPVYRLLGCEIYNHLMEDILTP